MPHRWNRSKGVPRTAQGLHFGAERTLLNERSLHHGSARELDVALYLSEASSHPNQKKSASRRWLPEPLYFWRSVLRDYLYFGLAAHGRLNESTLGQH